MNLGATMNPLRSTSSADFSADQVVYAVLVRGLRLFLHGPLLRHTSEFPKAAEILRENRENTTEPGLINTAASMLQRLPSLAQRAYTVPTACMPPLPRKQYQYKRMTESIARPTTAADSMRETFIASMLENRSGDPFEEFSRIASLWSDVMGATWSWIWLKNSQTDTWEIVGVGRDTEQFGGFLGDQDIPADFPDELSPGDPCIAELVTLTGVPEFVEDVSSFKRSIKSKTFRVSKANWFREHHITSLDTVPFEIESQSYGVTVHGVVCSHYGDLRNRYQQNATSLSLMGKLTGQAIANIYEGLFFKIIVELNDLAGEYLTTTTKRPDLDCREYLSKVARVIKGAVRADSVSVFYPDPLDGNIRCQYSTGLCDGKNPTRGIDEEDVRALEYSSSDGSRTSQCWQRCEPIFIPENDPKMLVAKYLEFDWESSRPVVGPTVLMPVCPPKRDAADLGRVAEGVVRCTGHPSPIDKSRQRNFDPLETETLRFICEQISPIMHTFSARIGREHQISVTKHDIHAPLNMIESTIKVIREDIQTLESQQDNGVVSPYRFLDLEMAVEAARNLAARLEANPREIRIEPKKTLLEGELVARMSALLRHYASKYGMSIVFDSFRHVPPLYIDRDVIGRVFYNLVVNAIKYGESGSTIRVTPRVSRSGYYIDVSNKGMEIPASDAAKIFEPYFRSAEAGALRMGAGLGLYIGRAGMEQHGGKLLLKSAKAPVIFSMFFPHDLRWSWNPESKDDKNG